MKKYLPKFIIIILVVTLVTVFSYPQKDKINEIGQPPLTPLLKSAGVAHVEKLELEGTVKDYGREAKAYKVKKINAKEKALKLAQVFNLSVTSEKNNHGIFSVSGLDGDRKSVV